MLLSPPADSVAVGGIRTIPPGFTRGLDFGPLADDPTSNLIEEEEEEVEVKPIYRPMLELQNEGRAKAVTVSLTSLRGGPEAELPCPRTNELPNKLLCSMPPSKNCFQQECVQSPIADDNSR